MEITEFRVRSVGSIFRETHKNRFSLLVLVCMLRANEWVLSVNFLVELCTFCWAKGVVACGKRDDRRSILSTAAVCV